MLMRAEAAGQEAQIEAAWCEMIRPARALPPSHADDICTAIMPAVFGVCIFPRSWITDVQCSLTLRRRCLFALSLHRRAVEPSMILSPTPVTLQANPVFGVSLNTKCIITTHHRQAIPRGKKMFPGSNEVPG